MIPALFFENLFLLDDVQHAIRLILAHVECGQIRFAGACCRNNKRTAFALLAQLHKIHQRFDLHGIRGDGCVGIVALPAIRLAGWCVLLEIFLV